MLEIYITLLLIGITVAIAVIPFWYPKCSKFNDKAREGARKLSNLDNTRKITSNEFTLPPDMDEAIQDYSVLEDDDAGFKEIRKSIASHTELDFRPVRFELVHHCPEQSNSLIGEDGYVRKLEQVYLKVEYSNGESARIINSPSFEIDRGLQLTRLREWISDHSRRRSHAIVTFLAVVWGTISVASIILL